MRPVPLDMLPPELGGVVDQANAVPLDLLPLELGGIEPQPEKSGFLRQVADIPLGVAKGAVTGVGMLANLFGADTSTANSIRSAQDYLNGLMSAEARNDQQAIARIMQEAEGKGMGQEVRAALRAFATAPVDLLSQAAGTVAPTLLAAVGAKVLGAGALAATAVGAGTGAGMGAGVVKGTIYEETKKALLDAGTPEDQAEARASLAQSYGGRNLDMILAGGALGGLAATTGVEKALIGPISRRILGSAASKEAGEQAAKGIARRVAGTAAAEAIPEFAQASQEQFAGNLALQREGFERDLMAGVVGAGTLEALAGAGLGAGAGALSGRAATPGAPVPPDALPPEIAPVEPQAEPPIEPQAGPAVEQEPVVSPPTAVQPPQAIETPQVIEPAPVETELPLGEPPPFETRPPEFAAPLPLPDYIQRTEEDIQRELSQIKELESIKPTPTTSLYEFFAFRPKRGKQAETDKAPDNRLDMSEVFDVSPDATFNFIRKKGGKKISDFISTGELNPWLKGNLQVFGTETAEELAEKESAAEEYIKDRLRERDYLTEETKDALENASNSLKQLESILDQDLSEYESDEKRRQDINDLLAEISQQYEAEQLTEEPVTTTPPGTEGGIGEPVSEIRPVSSLQEVETGKPFSFRGFRGRGKSADEIYTDVQIPIAGPARYVAPTREEAAEYGDNITEEDVTLNNPLVIRTDDQWKKLARDAGWEFPNPFGLDADTIKQYTDNLSRLVQSRGHDGLVIDPSPDGDIAKTIRRVFAHAQIVDYTQPAPAAVEPQTLQISPEEQVQEVLKTFNSALYNTTKPFRSIAANGRRAIIRPKDVSSRQIKLLMEFARDAIDLGMPVSLFSSVKSAGMTGVDSIALISPASGSLMLGKKWGAATRAEKLATFVHEFGHIVDFDFQKDSFGVFSQVESWKQPHAELKAWYDKDPNPKNPVAYPFSKTFDKRLPDKRIESFPQAFAYYFTNPVGLQSNAPTAYAAIQSIVERIQNESQPATRAGAAAATTPGVQVRKAGAEEGAGVQPPVGGISPDIGRAERIEDRAAAGVEAPIVSDSELQQAFDAAEEIPSNVYIDEIKDNWEGGVANFGDRDVMYLLPDVPGGPEYRQQSQRIARQNFGDRFMGYRLMSMAEYEALKAGDVGDIVSFSLSKKTANAFRNFAGNRKRTDLVLAQVPLTPEHVVMFGKRGEKELVIDTSQGWMGDEFRLAEPLRAEEPSIERPAIKLRRDNPGGEWLKNKQKLSIEDGKNEFNVPNRFGSPTGTLSRKILVPVDKLARVKGMRGEQMAENIRPESLRYLSKQMSETGRLPPSSVEGEDYVPFLNIYQDGTPYVNEGNHRVMVAKQLGWKYIPVQISWFNGAEQAGGEFSPEALFADDARAYEEGYSLESYSQAPRAAEPTPEEKRRADMERDLFRLNPEFGQFAPTTGVQGDLFGATGQLTPTPQVLRRKRNNTEQLNLFLDGKPDDSQPDSQDARVDAVEAVEQLQESNNPLAMQLADELANRQTTMLVGKKAASVDDMAFLAQVYRDPRFETFRVFFTDSNGNIISQLGLTSRMPGSTVAVIGESESAYFNSVANVAKQKGATGYFLVHNHPSGVVTASPADRVISKLYADRFSQLEYKGHVIINTNKYGVVNASGTFYEVEKDLGQAPMPGQLGELGVIKTLDDAAAMAKQMEVSADDVVLLSINLRGNIMQVSTIPASAALSGNKPRLIRTMQKMVLKARGANLVVVSRNNTALAPFIGFVKDAIHINENGQVLASMNIGRKIFGGDRPGRVAAATSPEFNYLKSPNLRQAPQIPPSMFNRLNEEVEDNPNSYNMRRNIFGQPVEASWGRQEESKLDTFIHVLQDKMIDVKRVQEQIKKAGRDISDRWNAYLKEELFHGRAAKKTKDFLTFELDPLMREMEKRGVTMAEFEDYLHNRAAKERNQLVAERDPENFPDGGSGILTADAEAYLANLTPKQRTDFEALAGIVDKITKGTRNLLVETGHESADTIKAWEEALPNYVPLNRVETDYELGNMGTGVGQGYGVRGAFSRAVVGSERPVVNILANIAMQRERAIVRTEKMRVAQAVYGLVLQNPNPGFWLAVDPEAQANPQDLENIVKTLVAMGFRPDSPEVSSFADLAKSLMEQPTIRAVDQSTNSVVRRANLALLNSPYALPVRINGSDKYVFFNPNDPIAERMAKSFRNVDADQMDKVLGPIAKITRYFAAINTQYNPIFGVINFLRDMQGALIQLSNTPLNGKQKQVIAQTNPALRGIYEDLRARREGRQAKGEWVDLWNQFQDLGGQTGFRDQFSRSDERADALYAVMNPSSWTETKLGRIFTVDGRLKVPLETARRSVAKPLFDWLSDYNETMENAIRLSAFKTGLDSGLSPEQAASVAKNLTVNFNRKGLIGKQAGALFAFFNASVQGTARMASTLFKTKDGKVSLSKMGKRIFYGGLLLGSAQAMLLAAAGFDEDEPPEFIKERNIVIPLPGGNYVTIPMPLGYNVIPNTSRVMTEWALSGFKDTSKRVAQITGAMLEMFNPIGNAGWSWQTFSPTIADPAVALFENRDWTGKPIAKEDFSSLDPTPGYTRARETASWFSKNLSEFLNLASGGTSFQKGLLSPTPDQIDYLIGQLTGGVGRELMKAEQTLTASVTGEELPKYKIPLVGRFVGDVTGQAAVGNKFYANLIELNGHQREIEGRQKARQNVQEYIQENPEARLYKMADRIQRNVSQLRKRRAEMLERGATKEQIKVIENQITKQMQQLNEAVDRMRK